MKDQILKEYDFIDFGCSNGGSIEYACMKFAASKGIGIDIDPNKVEKAKAKGYHAILADVTKLNINECAKVVSFITMIHFLEHLQGFDLAEKCINSAVNLARDFIYIKQPFFDADTYLFTKGFKFYWSDWNGHKYNMTSFDMFRILNRLKLQSQLKRFVFYGDSQVISSADLQIHPLLSPVDQFHYDANKHLNKNEEINFNEAVYSQLEVFIAIEDNKTIDYCVQKMGTRGVKLYDSMEI